MHLINLNLVVHQLTPFNFRTVCGNFIGLICSHRGESIIEKKSHVIGVAYLLQ